MEITADNINVSSDEPQTFFLCVLNAGKRDNSKLLLHSVGQVKKKKKGGNNHKYWLLIR